MRTCTYDEGGRGESNFWYLALFGEWCFFISTSTNLNLSLNLNLCLDEYSSVLYSVKSSCKYPICWWARASDQIEHVSFTFEKLRA